MTKHDIIAKIKSMVAHHLSNNKYAKIDFVLLSDIYDTIKQSNITPDNKLVAIHDKYGYIYEGGNIRLKDGALLSFLCVCNGYAVIRYSGYYPFIIDIDKVNDKIDEIDKINQINQ